MQIDKPHVTRSTCIGNILSVSGHLGSIVLETRDHQYAPKLKKVTLSIQDL
jgi:hypothetical protein